MEVLGIKENLGEGKVENYTNFGGAAKNKIRCAQLQRPDYEMTQVNKV